MTDRLSPNQQFAIGSSLTSSNGQYAFVMQGDGKLVLYRGGRVRWATGTNGSNVTQLIMQGDGDFVMYGSSGRLWSSRTSNNPGASLLLQNDGNVVIYSTTGRPLWATNTSIPTVEVPGFLPSTSAFRFSNSSFPQGTPDVTINLLGQKITIGDASWSCPAVADRLALDFKHPPTGAATINGSTEFGTSLRGRR